MELEAGKKEGKKTKKKPRRDLVDLIFTHGGSVTIKFIAAAAAILTLVAAPIYTSLSLAACHNAPWHLFQVIPDQMIYGMSFVAIFVGAAFGWTITFMMCQRHGRRMSFFRSYRQVVIGVIWWLILCLHMAAFVMIALLYFMESSTVKGKCANFHVLYQRYNAFLVVFFFIPGVLGALNWLVFLFTIFCGMNELRKRAFRDKSIRDLEPYFPHARLVDTLHTLKNKHLFSGCITYINLIADPELGTRDRRQEAREHITKCNYCGDNLSLINYLVRQERKGMWYVPKLQDICTWSLRETLKPNVWDGVAKIQHKEVKKQILLDCDFDNYLDMKEKKVWISDDW